MDLEGHSSQRAQHREPSKQDSGEDVFNKAQQFKNLLEGDLTSVRSSVIFEDDKEEKENGLQNAAVTSEKNLPNSQKMPEDQ